MWQYKIVKVISKKLVCKVLELTQKSAKEEESGDDEDAVKKMSLEKIYVEIELRSEGYVEDVSIGCEEAFVKMATCQLR